MTVDVASIQIGWIYGGDFNKVDSSLNLLESESTNVIWTYGQSPYQHYHEHEHFQQLYMIAFSFLQLRAIAENCQKFF